MNIQKTWKVGLGAGLAAGILDALLIYFADPSATTTIIIQSLIAWTIMGWIVVSTNSGLKPMLHGILITILINIPWYIQFSAQNPSHLGPLLIQSIVFGTLFGYVKKKLYSS